MPEPVKPAQSVQEYLREQHSKRMRKTEVAVELPDWPDMYVRFRSLDDYSEVRDVAQEITQAAHTEVQGEIQIGIATLRLSAVAAYARIDGEQHPIPNLGLGLYNFLYPEGDPERPEIGPQDDDEAIVMLFKGTGGIMTVAAGLAEQFGQTGLRVDEELAKNS